MKGNILQKRILILVALTAAMTLVMTSFASASSCTTIGCLNPNDHYDWTANYGPPFSNIPNNSTAVSVGGLNATLHLAGGDGQRRDQGNGWNGNFNPGDELVWTQSNGPLTFTFQNPVNGVGAQIQADFFGAFTALIQAFDSNGNLIESFSENGVSNSNGDGSAIFIGLLDQGIKSVEFSLTSCTADCTDFAINSLQIVSGTRVPEPASLVLLGSGLFGLAGTIRRSMKKRS